jgi:hypothetical protein
MKGTEFHITTDLKTKSYNENICKFELEKSG